MMCPAKRRHRYGRGRSVRRPSCDNDVLARDAKIGDGLSENFLRFAIGVDIRRIDEVMPASSESPTSSSASFCSTPQRTSTCLRQGEGHGAEAELRYEKAGVAEGVVRPAGSLPNPFVARGECAPRSPHRACRSRGTTTPMPRQS